MASPGLPNRTAPRPTFLTMPRLDCRAVPSNATQRSTMPGPDLPWLPFHAQRCSTERRRAGPLRTRPRRPHRNQPCVTHPSRTLPSASVTAVPYPAWHNQSGPDQTNTRPAHPRRPCLALRRRTPPNRNPTGHSRPFQDCPAERCRASPCRSRAAVTARPHQDAPRPDRTNRVLPGRPEHDWTTHSQPRLSVPGLPCRAQPNDAATSDNLRCPYSRALPGRAGRSGRALQDQASPRPSPPNLSSTARPRQTIHNLSVPVRASTAAPCDAKQIRD